MRVGGATFAEARVPGGARDTALHGDRVRLRPDRQRNGQLTASVVEVIERRAPILVGRVRRRGRSTRLVFRDGGQERELRLEPSDGDDLRQDAWAVAEVTEYAAPDAPLAGRLTEVLGEDGAPGVDVSVLLRRYGVREAFPAEVEAEAAALPARLPRREVARRSDLRDRLTFTIDSASARDLDDAISIVRRGRRGWRLWVHVADVSFYVEAATALDAEAFERGTSIYPFDRVVPMLPAGLSEDRCSLLPGGDRFALTCVLDLEADGATKRCEIVPAVIRSDHRLTYDEVQAMFDRADQGFTPLGPSPECEQALLDARELSRVLRRKRRERGAIHFDSSDARLAINRSGSAVGVRRPPRLESHLLIEDLMIAANEAVARYARDRDLPVPYRAHRPPPVDRVREVVPVLRSLGVRPPKRLQWSRHDVADLLRAATGHESPSLVRRWTLRAMDRAEYGPDPDIGHFGLASTGYLHFTSPIRRYPDLLVHRTLRADLRGLDAKRRTGLREALPERCEHCGQRERRAGGIEMEAHRRKLLGLIDRFRGEEFDAVVVDVMHRGANVELAPLGIEGLLPVRSLRGWRADAGARLLRGRGRDERIGIGDRLVVRPESVDLDRGWLDVALVSGIDGAELDAGGGRRRRSRRRSRSGARRGGEGVRG